MSAPPPPVSKTVPLPPNAELRLECQAGSPVAIRLEEGSAEVFGTELQLGRAVSVTGQKLAVFTWEGCKIAVLGEPSVSYVATETPMEQYINVHQTLNSRRQSAQQSGSLGPVCVVAGPTDSGKSTLCRMLCNWAVRSEWQPTFVDLDVGQGTITVPGCIAAVPVDSPIDVEEGYAADIPLVFYYGHSSPDNNPSLFKHLVEKLASVLQRRAQANAVAGASGLIINTFGWVDGLGYELQKHIIQAFQADIVLVMEQDRLHAQLQQDIKASTAAAPGTGTVQRIEIIKMPKSGGAVARQPDERRLAREGRIREYFYGVNASLAPAAITCKAEQLVVYRIGTGPRAPNSALPLGAVSRADPLRLTNLPVNMELLQCLVAVSHAQTPDQIPNTNVAGFVLIKDVDTARGLVTYLSPAPGPLPGRYLLTGSLRSTLD